MKPPIPRTLAGQTLLVLVAGLVLSHAVGFTIYSLDRHEIVSSTEATDFAERVAGVIVLLQKVPPPWREDVVRGSDSRVFRVFLSEAPAVQRAYPVTDVAIEVASYLKSQFPDWPAARMRVELTETAPPGGVMDHPRSRVGSTEPLPEAASNQEERDFLSVSMAFEDGEWLNFAGALQRIETNLPRSAGAYVLTVAAGVAIVAVWLVFRVVGPLTSFAAAADRIGKNIRAEPLPEAGPLEVAKASQALNSMQQRLCRLIDNRTQMLGAISHDLRTPITLLRLRAELMEDAVEQKKVLDTLDEMEAMIRAVLDFSKGAFSDEPQRHVDIAALLESLCDDLVDTGLPVEFVASDAVLYSCRRVALKRAFGNLIDNAVKYGGRARVELHEDAAGIVVTIDDEGPGIPEEFHEKVFLSFFRLDASRSRDAGGVGLGLTIAQAIVEGHGGEIRLSNRQAGGLRVRVSLPK